MNIFGENHKINNCSSNILIDISKKFLKEVFDSLKGFLDDCIMKAKIKYENKIKNFHSILEKINGGQ